MLSKDEVQALLRLVKLTAENELDCGQFLTHVASFAERVHSKEVEHGELTAQMLQHLEVCPECEEEFQAVLSLLKGDC